jgi:predicted RecA/RadA family phage recombinase
MANIFHQEHGDVIEIVAAADITANDIIDIGGSGQVGVALASCLSGEKVNIKLNGVIKAGKPAETHALGAVLTANVAPTNTFSAAGGVAAKGVCVAASGDSEAYVLVKLIN